jgi:hypothetical protein
MAISGKKEFVSNFSGSKIAKIWLVYVESTCLEGFRTKIKFRKLIMAQKWPKYVV